MTKPKSKGIPVEVSVKQIIEQREKLELENDTLRRSIEALGKDLHVVTEQRWSQKECAARYRGALLDVGNAFLAVGKAMWSSVVAVMRDKRDVEI